MAETKTSNLVIKFGNEQYKIIGSRLEDICKELNITEYRFVELLSRDFYCPTLSAAPSSSTLTYIDTDGSENHFAAGQPCRWQENGKWRLALMLDNTGDVASWYMLPAEFVTQEDLNDKQDKNLYFYNVKAEGWVADTTYQGFTHRCDLPCTGVTAAHHAEVLFAWAEATSGNYAPVCESKMGYVSIWSNKTDTIIVSQIIIQK